jgi:hypothetical protein
MMDWLEDTVIEIRQEQRSFSTQLEGLNMENGLNTHLLNIILLNSEIKQEIQKTDAYLSFAKFKPTDSLENSIRSKF